jgi:hypothetical protein
MESVWLVIFVGAAVCVAILWVGALVRGVLRAREGVRLLRGHRRLRRGCCPACGYDLTGNTSGTCPECGTAVTA